MNTHSRVNHITLKSESLFYSQKLNINKTKSYFYRIYMFY